MNNYVTSYRNPDTDGVACIIALCDAHKGFIPAIRGELSPETSYVLDKVGIDEPEPLESLADSNKIIVVDTHHKDQLDDDFPYDKVELVVDHHTGGDDPLFKNAKIDNREIGAAASIVAEMLFEEGGVSEKIAELLQYAIVSNTLDFKAPSTSEFDKEIYEKLSDVSGVRRADLDGMFSCGKAVNHDASTLVKSDIKSIRTFVGRIAIAQIEERNLSVNGQEIREALEKEYVDKGYSYAIFNGVDIGAEKSKVVFSSNITDQEIKDIYHFKSINGEYNTDRILLRKTDFIPRILDYYSIVHQLTQNNCIIVLDTNVLLNIYRYSPEFSEYALACLKVDVGDGSLLDYIYLPATVFMEFKRHYKSEYFQMKKKIDIFCRETKDVIDSIKVKALKSCNGLEKRRFNDTDELRRIINDGLEAVKKLIDDFFEDRKSNLELIADSWGNNDYVRDIVKRVKDNDKVMAGFNQEELYDICDEGFERYKKEIPPGFKDGGGEITANDRKGKDGIRKYSDLILWNEIIKFCNENRKNLIFVTDDVKPDWWADKNEKLEFQPKLYAEFRAKTKDANGNPLVLYPFVSKDFYEAISNEWGLEKSDVVELALKLTDEDYIDNVKDQVLDEAISQIIYSGEEYIDMDAAHIGSEGINELIFDTGELARAFREERNVDEFIYLFTYNIKMEGTSYDYWGRDGREIITSSGTDHIFEGELDVEVRRKADIFRNISDDTDFTSVCVIDCRMEEVSYKDRDDVIDVPDAYTTCPKCGRPINYENDAGTGFCIDCSREIDW